MTEIPVFPAGGPPVALAEPGDTSTLHGLLAALHINVGRLADRLPDPHRELREEAQALYPVRIDPVPFPALSGGAGTLDIPQLFGPRMGQNWDIHAISVTGFTTLSGGLPNEGTGTITAGAGSASLAGFSITSFTLSFSAAPSTAGTATLSGVSGGPLTYSIPVGQTSPFSVTFPTPLTPSAVPTLTVAGLGTGAGTIVMTGISQPATAGQGVYGWINQPSNTAGGAQRFYLGASGFTNYGKGQLMLRGNGDRLVFTATGLAAASAPIVSIDATRVADLYVGRYLL